MTTRDESQETVGRLSPADVNGVLFTRAGRGKRGYDEVEVDVFLDRVQAEISRLIAEKGDLRDEAARLRNQLADGSGPLKDEASIQAVRVLSVAQQTADQYVADAEHYSRRVTSDAREHYEEIIAEARARARMIHEDAQRQAVEASGEPALAGLEDGDGPVTARSRQELEAQVSYLRTYSQVCRVQLRAYLEALLTDIEEEWGRADPAVLMGQRSLPPGRAPVTAGAQGPDLAGANGKGAEPPGASGAGEDGGVPAEDEDDSRAVGSHSRR